MYHLDKAQKFSKRLSATKEVNIIMDLSLANLIDVGIEDDFHSSDVYIVDSFSLFIINFAGTSFFLEYAPYCTSFYYTSQIFCLNIFIMHSIYQKG